MSIQREDHADQATLRFKYDVCKSMMMHYENILYTQNSIFFCFLVPLMTVSFDFLDFEIEMRFWASVFGMLLSFFWWLGSLRVQGYTYYYIAQMIELERTMTGGVMVDENAHFKKRFWYRAMPNNLRLRTLICLLSFFLFAANSALILTVVGGGDMVLEILRGLLSPTP